MKGFIHLILISIVFSCANNNKPQTSKDSNVIAISNYLDSLQGFSGAVLIAKNDSIVFQKPYGFAHLGHRIKNNTETKFSYASIGKSFTAVAIFQLIQSGQLSLEDRVGKFLPNYPNTTVRDSITIEMLLKHRSGLANYFHSEKLATTSKSKFRTIEDLSTLYENEPLEFRPNEQFAYRNTNYIILGRIIEVVSDIPYDNYIKTNIFDKANMLNTGNYDIDHIIENSAEHYTLSSIYPNELQKTTFMNTVKGSSAGGGYTTVEDLYLFALAFKRNRLLNENFTNIMSQNPNNEWYGFGIQFAGAENSGIYGHSGGHYGVGAEWRIYSKQDYIVTLLTNKDLDQGFLDARFFIEKTISGNTDKLDNYFFTKDVIQVCLEEGTDIAMKMVNESSYELSERDLNSKGYEMIKRGFYKKAISIFTLETLAFPKSYDAYDSLGEAYMKDDQKDNAIKFYNLSIQLNPNNTNAKEKLEALNK